MGTPAAGKTKTVITEYTDLVNGDQHVLAHDELVAQKRRPLKRNRRIGKVFALLDTASYMQLELTISQQKILGVIIGHADPRWGHSLVRNAFISEKTGIATSNVSANIRELVRRNILIRADYGAWLINPWLLFMGNQADWDKTAKSYDEPIWKRAADADQR